MKKVLILLMLLVVSCGGSSDETVVEDTTTTTIPPAPTVDFNIVDIYNKNLGSESELCSDATEIETTSEKCLRQYRDNLETVFSFDKSLYTYITELNTYLESYPSAMTEEYTVLFEFLNNQYRDVPETYGLVLNKYFERFGGEPVVNIVRDLNSIESGCKLVSKVEASENITKLQLIYTNEYGDEFKLIFNEFNSEISKTIDQFSGNFNLFSAIATNYMGEEFSLNIQDSFTVTNALPRVTSIQVINNTPNLEKNEVVKVQIEYEPGTYYDFFEEIFLGLYNIENKSDTNNQAIFRTNAENSYTQGGEINKEEGYILLSLIFSDTRIPKNDEWATTIPLGPYSKSLFIGYYSFHIGDFNLFGHHNLSNFGVFNEFNTACGPKDNIKTTATLINNEIFINP